MNELQKLPADADGIDPRARIRKVKPDRTKMGPNPRSSAGRQPERGFDGQDAKTSPWGLG
jgi:hypothetical protein